MRIAFGTDERTSVTEAVKEHLVASGHEVEVVGEGDPWPDVGHRVGRAVADDAADFGVVCCWTGTGVSIAANKVPEVRAALCTDPETAAGSRTWNDANVLAFGLRLTSEAMAREMIDAFLAAVPDRDEMPAIDRVEAPL